MLALANPEQVKGLIAFNTEIPNHRPPWIPTYQFLAALPLANPIFRLTMKSKLWQASPLGFGQFYSNKSYFKDDSNLGPYLDPVLTSAKRMAGLLGYIRGIEWDVIDQLQHRHSAIKADVLLLWGESDKTFPVKLAHEMVSQFGGAAKLIPIAASLLPHEEAPRETLEHITKFVDHD